MKPSKHLKNPLILFSILILITGAMAATGFGGDDEGSSRSGFGADVDDHTSYSSDSDTDNDTSSSDTESTQTNQTLRDGFGDDTDDEGPANTSSTQDNQTLRDGFGSDTDDANSSISGMGNDTDDEGTSRDGFGNDTDDEGTSRTGFGSDTDDTAPENPPETDEDDSENDQESEDDSESTSNDDSDSSDESDEAEPGLTASISPQTVDAGETVTVEGEVEGSAQDHSVIVKLNDNPVATAQPESDGDFETSFTPQETGSHTVTVSVADISKTYILTVEGDSEQTSTEPSVNIDSVTWPDSVRVGDSFQICADVESSSTPEVTLYRDGSQVDAMEQQGTSCFTTTADREGDVHYRVEAEVDGETDSKAAMVNAYTSTGSSTPTNTGNSGQTNPATGGFLSSMSSGTFVLILLVLIGLAAAGGATYRYYYR